MDDRRLDNMLTAAFSQQAQSLALMKEIQMNVEQIKQQQQQALDAAKRNTDAYAAIGELVTGLRASIASLQVELANVQSKANNEGQVKSEDLQSLNDGMAALNQSLNAEHIAQQTLLGTLADPQVNNNAEIPPGGQPSQNPDADAPTPIEHNVTDPGIVQNQRVAADATSAVDTGTATVGATSDNVGPVDPPANSANSSDAENQPAQTANQSSDPSLDPATQTDQTKVTESVDDKPLGDIKEEDLGPDPNFEDVDDDNDPSTPPVRRPKAR